MKQRQLVAVRRFSYTLVTSGLCHHPVRLRNLLRDPQAIYLKEIRARLAQNVPSYIVDSTDRLKSSLMLTTSYEERLEDSWIPVPVRIEIG
jgi:hypothetical protein